MHGVTSAAALVKEQSAENDEVAPKLFISLSALARGATFDATDARGIGTAFTPSS